MIELFGFKMQQYLSTAWN